MVQRSIINPKLVYRAIFYSKLSDDRSDDEGDGEENDTKKE